MSTDLDHVPNETRADAMRVEEASATDPMAAQMMRMTAAAWQAADAVRAVQSAQRAHLEATRKPIALCPCGSCVTCSCAARPALDQDGLCQACGGTPLMIARLAAGHHGAPAPHVGSEIEAEERAKIQAMIDTAADLFPDEDGEEDVHPDLARRLAGSIASRPTAKVVIHNEQAAQAALDGLVRYLADKPADAVRAVAALLEVLAPGKGISRSVQIAGGPDAGPYTRLLNVPGVTLDTIPSYDPLDVIDLVRVEIGGIFGARITASRRRPLGSAPEVP